MTLALPLLSSTRNWRIFLVHLLQVQLERNSQGEAQMVDFFSKQCTKRTAIASCQVLLGKKVFDLVSANQMAKGDVLSVAKIAGISGAKHTSNLIPLCHNISLPYVRVDLALNRDEYNVEYNVEVKVEASTTGKTGVEMEAMTAVTIADLNSLRYVQSCFKRHLNNKCKA